MRIYTPDQKGNNEESFPELFETDTLDGIAARNSNLDDFSNNVEQILESGLYGYLTSNRKISLWTTLARLPLIIAIPFPAILNQNAGGENIRMALTSYLGLAILYEMASYYVFDARNEKKEIKENDPLIIFEKTLFHLGKRIFYDGPKGMIDKRRDNQNHVKQYTASGSAYHSIEASL